MRRQTNLEELDKRLNRKSSPVENRNYYPPEDPAFSFKLTSFLLVVGIIIPGINTFMNLMNRTKITGKENLIGLEPPWILASNHLTMLDDLFLDPLLMRPYMLKGYNYFPYHAPEETNFYKKPLMSWFMRQVKSIPLIRGNGIFQDGMNRLIDAVNDNGILHIFPEGTRSRTGKIGDGKPGIGRIVSETNAIVVPMFHQGLERILPIGKYFPRFGTEVRIAIGKPIHFSKADDDVKEVAHWRAISRRVIKEIKEQREVANRKWGHKPIITGYK